MRRNFEKTDRIHRARNEYVRLRNEQMKLLRLAENHLASGEPQALAQAQQLQTEAMFKYTESLGKLARFLHNAGVEPSQLA